MIRQIQRTKNSEMLVVLDSENDEGFAGVLEQRIGEGATATNLERAVNVEIRDIDEEVSEKRSGLGLTRNCV